jgi:aminoglycoside 6'-N-acetyltransferase I
VGILDIRFYPVGDVDENEMRYAVIAAQYGGEWVFVRQKTRSTWEIPGGRKEQGESIFQTARRELYEETGALDYELREICDYSVTRDDTSYGRLFYAYIRRLGTLPESEIAEVLLQEELPLELTYPKIQPFLLKKVKETILDIVEATEEDLEPWARLGLLLWPDHTFHEMYEIFVGILESKRETAFLCWVGQECVGFIDVSIRVDYVEGSDSSPVGFVEGIYVKDIYRKQGIAQRLVARGEKWAQSQGCTQMGSDIEQHNTVSYDFHTKVGFQEANRIICFIKDID